jgi:hypothetical protein
MIAILGTGLGLGFMIASLGTGLGLGFMIPTLGTGLGLGFIIATSPTDLGFGFHILIFASLEVSTEAKILNENIKATIRTRTIRTFLTLRIPNLLY